MWLHVGENGDPKGSILRQWGVRTRRKGLRRPQVGRLPMLGCGAGSTAKQAASPNHPETKRKPSSEKEVRQHSANVWAVDTGPLRLDCLIPQYLHLGYQQGSWAYNQPRLGAGTMRLTSLKPPKS